MHAFTFLSLVGATATVFLAVQLCVRPSENRPAALTFAGFLGCCVLLVLDDACYRENGFARWPWFYAVANPFIVAIGPTFFLYACAAAEPEFRWRGLTWLHFLPALLGVLLEIPTYAGSVEEKLQQAAHDHDSALTSQNVVFVLLHNLYLIGYIGSAWWRLWQQRERVSERQEEGRAHPLRGIHFFATLVLAIVVLSAILDFTPWARLGVSVSVLATVLAVCAVVWSATQPGSLVAPAQPSFPGVPSRPSPPLPVSTGSAAASVTAREASSDLAVTTADAEVPRMKAPAAEIPTAPTTVSREAKVFSELSRAEAERISARVRALLEIDRAFTDPELSLQALAEQAKTTRHKLSATLRQVFGATFYQVIAGYRVREAARVLETKDGVARTIADIAFSSGFNTLSAFNAAFRAEFGVTPSTFRERAQKKTQSGDLGISGR